MNHVATSASALSRGQRNLLLALAALLALAVFWRGSAPPVIPYAPETPAPAGTLALWLWLEEMGYEVQPLEQAWTRVPAGDLLFVFPGQRTYTEAAAATLVEWVGAGGVLVLIGPSALDTSLIEAFGVAPAADALLVSHLRQTQPILPERPARWPAPGRVQGLDLRAAPGALPLVVAEAGAGSGERVTVALQARGAGQVWHLDAYHDFTNARLRNVDQAGLLPALLRGVPGGVPGSGRVLLDAYHLYPAPPTAGTPTDLRGWLFGTRGGLAVLLACGLTLAYLALQGIRLGPPLRDANLVQPRAAAEYVDAMAGLYQRGNRRAAVARQVKRRLKMRLAQIHGIAPGEADAPFVAQLAQVAGGLSAAQVAQVSRLLAQLDRPLDDAQLLHAAQAAQTVGVPVGDPGGGTANAAVNPGAGEKR
ncbi:MAG: DUF4350 domain-containing protein [Litorilinea sp.]